ncbi:MAG TPA: serine hydrolase [Candidatus Eisenbacteria bacterium]|nr:serine hydrolase [Candidatus Eisenbacteria bacterium]
MFSHRFCASVTLLGVLCISSIAIAQAAPSSPSQPASKFNRAEFDAYVLRVMQDWKVPGVGIAIIKDGKVVLMQGYGLRDVKNNLPVTPQTLFPIASISKSFTVGTLATLSSEGKLDWDKPVREYLPDFRLEDDTYTARVTTRDLVTHRTGLPRHDAVWYNADLSREQIYDRLRYLDPHTDLRRQWEYNNLMFMTAGWEAGKLSGGTWEEAVTARVFKPLGMTSSNFDFGQSVKTSSDVSKAYRKDDDEVVHEVPPYVQNQALGPAGGIVSNLADLTQYVMMYLNNGKHGDQQVISAADVRQMTSPQMVIPSTGLDPELGFSNYGMGFFVTTYRGHKFVEHGGNLDGFSLLISFLPDDHVGSVVLCNMEATQLREVLTYHIYDLLLGLPPVDWNQRQLARYKAFKASEEEARKKNFVPRVTGTHFSHPIDDYVGEYAHPAYGTVTIARAGDDTSLKLTYHGMSSTAEHWHYDIWRTPHNPLDLLQETEFMFQTDWQGNIASLTSSMEPTVKDIVFTRQPDRRMRERSFLEPLAGTYQVADFKFVVTLRPDNVLTMTTPNGKVHELSPLRGYTFAWKDQDSVSIDFKHDPQGKVTEFALTEAGSSQVFKRAQ